MSEMTETNMTFDDWVEWLTSDKNEYKSLYPDRRSVANHLLCVIGNGYKLGDKYITGTKVYARSNYVPLTKEEEIVRLSVELDIPVESIRKAWDDLDKIKSPKLPYYPICEYSFLTRLTEEHHPSYIKAGLEICQEIMLDVAESPSNKSCAQTFINRFSKQVVND